MKLIGKFLAITIIPMVLCLTEGHSVYAQQKIDPTVEVTKTFEGNLMEIHKSRLTPAFDDSLSSFNLNFNYTIFDKPYKDLYEFTPLPSAQIQSPVNVKYPFFFARISAGYPFTPQADLYLQPRLKGPHSLVFYGSHHSFWGKLPLMKIDRETLKTEADKDDKIVGDNMENLLGADYGHSWKGGELSAGVKFSNNYYTYYGINPGVPIFSSSPDADKGSRKFIKDNLSHTYNQAGAYFRIRSAENRQKKAGFNYFFDFSYLHTSDKPRMEGSVFKENLFDIRGEFGPAFGRYSRFTIGVTSQTAVYSGPQEYHYGIIEAVPRYKFEKDRWIIRLGLGLSAKYTDKSGAGKYHSTLFAKADVSYEIVKDYLWAYGKADGWNDIRSYSSLLEENKWVGPLLDMKAGSVPLLVRSGLRGHFFSKFNYDVYVSYTVHKGLIQYVNYYEPYAWQPVPAYRNANSVFEAVYANHRELSAGGEISWQSKDFQGGAKIRYSSFTKGKKMSGNLSELPQQHVPFGYAPLEGMIYGEYNWRQRIFLGAEIHFRGAAPAYIYLPDAASFSPDFELRSFANLGIRLKYVVDNHFAVFIKGTDLLNQDIGYYPQYLEKGISFEGGVFIKF